MENSRKPVKRFYLKDRSAKIFFAPALSVLSTAYGDEVLAEFKEWRQYFRESWSNERDNFLVCEQGDVGGNPVRGNGSFYEFRAVPVRNSNSVLPPLWLGDQFFEVDGGGMLSINGEALKDSVNVGTELKAWAITSVRIQNRWKHFLLVIGKSGDAMRLSVYPVSEAWEVRDAVSTFDFAYTLAPKSFLAPFGRHIFIVHNGALHYLYFSPITQKLERVPVGEDGAGEDVACCNHVLPQVVCDEEGDVFWVANNTVYGIRIGSPRTLYTLEKMGKEEFLSMQCFGSALYLNTKYACTRYTCFEDGKSVAAPFGSNAECGLFISSGTVEIRYIKLKASEDDLLAQTMLFAGNREQRFSEPVRMKGAKTAFCFAENLVADVRYVGVNGRVLTAIEKETRRESR